MRRNEPIAFALNRGLVVIPGAERLWGNLLYCNWRFIQASPYRARFPRHLPETVRYVKKYERERPNADDEGCLSSPAGQADPPTPSTEGGGARQLRPPATVKATALRRAALGPAGLVLTAPGASADQLGMSRLRRECGTEPATCTPLAHEPRPPSRSPSPPSSESTPQRTRTSRAVQMDRSQDVGGSSPPGSINPGRATARIGTGTVLLVPVGRHYSGGAGQEYFAYQQSLGDLGAVLDARKIRPYVQGRHTVVDFGCGAGGILIGLGAPEPIGIEVNEAARRVAESRGLRVAASPSDLPAAIADMVISNHALETPPRPWRSCMS